MTSSLEGCRAMPVSAGDFNTILEEKKITLPMDGLYFECDLSNIVSLPNCFAGSLISLHNRVKYYTNADERNGVIKEYENFRTQYRCFLDAFRIAKGVLEEFQAMELQFVEDLPSSKKGPVKNKETLSAIMDSINAVVDRRFVVTENDMEISFPGQLNELENLAKQENKQMSVEGDLVFEKMDSENPLPNLQESESSDDPSSLQIDGFEDLNPKVHSISDDPILSIEDAEAFFDLILKETE